MKLTSQKAFAGAKMVGPILLQFPLYGGIMGIMTGTGLDAIIADKLDRVFKRSLLIFSLSAAFQEARSQPINQSWRKVCEGALSQDSRRQDCCVVAGILSSYGTE